MMFLAGKDPTAVNLLLASAGIIPAIIEWVVLPVACVIAIAADIKSGRRTLFILFLLVVLNHFIGVLLRSLFGPVFPSQRAQDAMFLTTWLLCHFRSTISPWVVLLAYVGCVFVGLDGLLVLDQNIASVFGAFIIGACVLVFNLPLAEDAFGDSLGG